MIEQEALRTRVLELISEEQGICMNDLVSSMHDSGDATFGLPDTFFANLLENYVHLDFTEEEAITHWQKIIENSAFMREKLGRKVGIYPAIVDYFTNTTHSMNSPMLVEIHVFRQTERLAMIDGLTGIFNRRYMDIILRKEFNRCDRYGKNLSICILDIDNFKQINDTKGHVFGDQVLRTLADMLKESIRDEDIVCRYGGEEFLIILPETNEEGAQILANRIRDEIKTSDLFADNRITFSAGTSTYPECAHEVMDLIQAADRALYQAKFAGKDRVMQAMPERRKFGRYEKSWELNVYAETKKKPISGIMTQNVSLGGAQFSCPVSYTIDTPVHLVFTNQEQEVPSVEVQGRITWVRKSNKTYVYGVSFNETPELFETTLIEQERDARTATITG